MHPADQYVAFAALLAEGKSVEDVAARFWGSAHHLTRRMKLGCVSSVIMLTYREDEITPEAVMAFTVNENHTEQEQVFGEIRQRGNAFYRNVIVRMLAHDKVPADDRPIGIVTPTCGWQRNYILCQSSANATAHSPDISLATIRSSILRALNAATSVCKTTGRRAKRSFVSM